MVSKWQVLSRLPEYRDQWKIVVEDQYVPDIMAEIGRNQALFGKYYDTFSDLFLRDNVRDIANELYDFCDHNISYKEETVKVQSSALPTGMLLRGKGDCKHYALFIGGVLGSLNRLYNTGIKWRYNYAAYKKGEDVPYHVFVSAWDPERDEELWIDPTPGSSGKTPTLLVTQ